MILQGLEYLHHDCDPSITHRDVKSNNILLDSNYQAHIADFGLAKELEIASGSLESMSAVAGSYGYIAPGTIKSPDHLSFMSNNIPIGNLFCSCPVALL